MQIAKHSSVKYNYNTANRQVSFGTLGLPSKGVAKAQSLSNQAVNEILSDKPLTQQEINAVLNMAARLVETSVAKTVGDPNKQAVLDAANNLRTVAKTFTSL